MRRLCETRKRLCVRHGLTPKPPVAAHLRQVGAVQDHEQETEALLHLPLPLLQHGGGGGDDHGAYFLAQQQLAGDKSSLDGLAEAGVVGDEQVHARQAQRLAQRLHLVGVDLDAGTEGRLEQVRIGGRDAIPAQRVQERAEVARRVEAPGAEVAHASCSRMRRSISKSQYTSRVWPWASSSAQARLTRADSRGGVSTASTSQRRERTSTSSPMDGAREGR